MNTIITYIEERIAKLEKEKEPLYGVDKVELYAVMCQIMELQAVLNKIKEREPYGHTATIKEVYPDGSFEVYTDEDIKETNK